VDAGTAAACGAVAARVHREDAPARLRRLRPCPASAEAAGGAGLQGEDSKGEWRMKRIAFAARVAIEVLLLVAAIVMILALPGLLDDTSSTAPHASTREAGR
jgi:hypothetical protein